MTDVIDPIRPNPDALKLLLTRRSRPARTLTLPVPTGAQVQTILTAASRVPDHGKLEPWRFIVLNRAALTRLAGIARTRGTALGLPPEAVEKGVSQFADAHLAIAVVAVPRPTVKIPEREQILSAGAVCQTALLAAQALGFGANWLTGWAVEDAAFRAEALGLAAGEWVAGLIHLGTEGAVPPERPRPDLAAIVQQLG